MKDATIPLIANPITLKIPTTHAADRANDIANAYVMVCAIRATPNVITRTTWAVYKSELAPAAVALPIQYTDAQATISPYGIFSMSLLTIL